MQTRLVGLLLAFGLVAAACGGTDTEAANNPTAGDDAPQRSAECDGTEATEVGVSADSITISVIADTGSPIAPGLFQGSVDALQGWANWKNANGGLACRDVVVDVFDSALNGTETKSAVEESCGSSLAMVGTTALFVSDMSAAEECVDKAGAATGMLDLAVIQTEAAHQCSPVSFGVIRGEGACPFDGEGEREFTTRVGAYQYYAENFDDLHGVYLVPTDLPSTIASTTPGYRTEQQFIPSDGEFGIGGRSPQTEYTPFVQTIKDKGSTFARCAGDVNCTIFLRQEAAAQGVDTVEVWDCSLQCYDRRLLEEGGEATEGTYTWIFFLPFEEASENETLQAFVDSVENPDGFGAQAWAAAEAFAQAVEAIVEADGINGITRAALLEAVTNITSFDAGGMLGEVNLGGKEVGGCFVLMQQRKAAFVRVHPEEPGTFDCGDDNLETITIDAAAEFKG